MSYPTPILRIEVEGVKHALLEHLQASRQEFEAIVAEEVEAFDVEAALRKEVRWLLPNMIHDAIVDAIEGVRTELTTEVREALRPQITKSLSAVWESVGVDVYPGKS